MRTGSSVFALCALLAFAGCSDDAAQEEPAPLLQISQEAARTFTISISGSRALRALQLELSYDPAALSVTRVETGRDAARIDRVFAGDPQKATDGALVLGITDTRQVLLPASGALFTVHFEPKGEGASAEIELSEALGVDDEVRAVAIEDVEGTLQLNR